MMTGCLSHSSTPSMAAEEALKKLEDQLNCPICLNTYTDPKQLQCNHVYCQQCLVKLVIQDQEGQLNLTCPNCRQVTPVPASGVAGLQAAFQINQLLEIVGEHKKANDATPNTEEVKNPRTSPPPHRNSTVGCPQHGGREVVLYCETCEKTICYMCTKREEKHNNHDYYELAEAFEKYQEEIVLSLEPMEKQLLTIEKAQVQLVSRREEISNQQATIEASIHDTFTQLHQTLDVRKTELINQLHQLTQAKLKSLAVQRDQIETTQAQLSSCLHFMRENLKTGNQGEALMMKSTTVRQIKELTTTFQPDLVEPKIEADVTFVSAADITEVILNYGKVQEDGSLDPSKCAATGKGTEAAVVGEKSTVNLQTLRFDNLPSKEALDSISCELVSEVTGTRVGGCVERRGQSQYEISYQPTAKGRHQLHIKVEGQHIRGSPFPVNARSPEERFGAPLHIINGTDTPQAVAIKQGREAFVIHKSSYCVSVFNPNGERLQAFCTQGTQRGRLQCPYGMAVDGEGCILVTSKNNHCIQKFTAEGRFLTAVGTEGSGPLQFKLPRGIAYNASNGKVYVVDWNNRVQTLNSDLSYAGSFGTAGSGQGQFNFPQHLACDSTGNIYVADCKNNRIQVFTAEGEFLRMIEKCGENGANLSEPYGLAVDAHDKVYVSECGNHCVSVFTSEGQFVTSFGRQGSRPGQFDNPTGLAVDSSGVVYVCDSRNSRVQLF